MGAQKNKFGANAALNQKKYKGRTIYILYVPGGAVQGIIPGVILSRLEELTETPASNLFQVLNGVSTGSLIAGGIAVRADTDPTKPRYLASNITELFCYWSGKFFPHIPHRFSKYLTATLFNYIRDATNPAVSDKILITALREKIKDISAQHKDKPAIVQELIDIRRTASAVYFGKRMQRRAARACEALIEHPDLSADTKQTLQEVNTLILSRRTTGMLSAQFNKVVNCGMNTTKRLWAKNYMYDPSVLENMLRDHIGESRMGDSLKSLYISTYDLKTRRMITFFNRRADFFSDDPHIPSETCGSNAKIWDAIMASTANPFAYPPHETEDGRLCSDKAILHTPLPCLEDVLRHKPEGTQVKLIYAGTGKQRYVPEHDTYEDFNVIRSLVEGRELDDLYRYNSTSARDIIREKIGPDNFIELNPYINATELDDLNNIPSPPNSMDASPENVQKILKLARDYIQQEDVDRQLKALAVEMAENLYHVGQMKEDKLQRIRRRCGEDRAYQSESLHIGHPEPQNRMQRMAKHLNPRRWFGF